MIHTDILAYAADGLAMESQLYWDDRRPGPTPGILVFPDAGGLSDHAKQRAERIAAEFGFAALACDLYGGQEQPQDRAGAMTRIKPLQTETERVRARVLPAFAALSACPRVDAERVGAIGFCLGGTMAFELALAGVDLKCAIGFHSGLKVTAPHDAGKICGRVAALVGDNDPLIPLDDRLAFEAMLREAGVAWSMSVYGGVGHAFTRPGAESYGIPGFAYDATADALSWQEMTALFGSVFESGQS